MPKWLPSIRRNERDGREKTVLELMVLEGVDAGQQFTVDGPEVRIGRGKGKTRRTGAIFLHDPSVSSEQATLRAGRAGSVLEHNPAATNPTLVNGRRIRRRRLKAGDEIRMGRVVIEVRERAGMSLSDLLQSGEQQTAPLEEDTSTTHPGLAAEPDGTGDETVYGEPAPPESRAFLRLVAGLPGLENQCFPLSPEESVVGRSRACQVSLPEPGISRQHCKLTWRESELTLSHLSPKNTTRVNGLPVEGERVLQHGDTILLADRVTLQLDLGDGSSSGARAVSNRQTLPLEPRDPSLRAFMEEKIERDRLIEEKFSVEGSFLDVDVVGSYSMKAQAERPAHIIVSFERFRVFVESVVNEFDGQVLNSNGDELMCFFDSTLQAVRAASAILSRLDDFNTTRNVLTLPFRFRIGIHTGACLVDRERGVAYSAVLDVAGHLQKQADVNGLLVSRDTLRALPEGLPFEPAAELAHEGIATYRMTAPID